MKRYQISMFCGLLNIPFAPGWGWLANYLFPGGVLLPIIFMIAINAWPLGVLLWALHGEGKGAQT